MNTKKIRFSSFLYSEFLPGSSSEEFIASDAQTLSADHKSNVPAHDANKKNDFSCHSSPRILSSYDHNKPAQATSTNSTGLPISDFTIRSRSRKDRRGRVLNFLRVPFALEYVLSYYFYIILFPIVFHYNAVYLIIINDY